MGTSKKSSVIWLVEPFYGGSHKTWLDGLVKHLPYDFKLLTLPGRHWKWRMHGGAVTLAQKAKELPRPDLVIASDMLDLGVFLSLSRKQTQNARAEIYFHENQIAYPWSETDPDHANNRNRHYGFINFTSACCADEIWFNSSYNRDSFLGGLPKFLKAFPDFQNLNSVQELQKKSKILELGMELSRFEEVEDVNQPSLPTFLWNHRWEFDKNPELFFEVLFELKNQGYKFKLNVLGESFAKSPKIFDEAKSKLRDEIVHWGYCPTWEDYAKVVKSSTHLLVTSNQDFFGGSVVEGIYNKLTPILPKRLAYPMHIEENFHKNVFYENKSQLMDILKTQIDNYGSIVEYNKVVRSYDWEIIKTKYENFIDSQINMEK